MKAKLIIAIKNHSDTAKTSGFIPTFFITVRDNPAPIKKSVNVKHCRATETIPCVNTFGIGKYVFNTIARIKNRINHGITILSPFDLK